MTRIMTMTYCILLMYTCISLVGGRANLFSIGVVYVVSNKAPSFPLSCLGVLFKWN